MQCTKCGKLFSNSYTLKRHLLEFCANRETVCSIPKKRLKLIGIDDMDSSVTKLSHAFKSRIASYRFTNISENKISYNSFFNDIKQKVLKKISEYLQLHTNLKVNMEVFGIYVKPDKELTDIKSMNSENKIITPTTNLEEIFDEFKSELLTQASEFTEKESNWSLQEIMFLDVNINRFNSIAASSYIKLPILIIKKNAVLNIENQDNACFAWCINAAIFPAEGDPKNPSSYPHYDTLLNFDGIDFPVKLKDIRKFENMNNISVNVFGLESYYKNCKNNYEIVGPLHFTSKRLPTHINLLLITDNEKSHYCLITDLSRLVRSQKTKHTEKIHICDGCLQSFATIEKLKAHEEHDCTHIYTELPTKEMKKNKCSQLIPENILKFVNFEKQLQVPFVIYADFESLLIPIDNCEPHNSKSFSVKVCEHVPYSFAFYLKCNYDDNLSKLEMYKGPDAAKVFVQKLDEVVHNLYNNHLKHVKPMLPLTPEEQEAYDNATVCHICERPFDAFNKKVRDHDHTLGKFRSAAHNSCNLNYKLPKFIPVFFHNLTNYDSHLFIKELTTKKESVSALAQTKEKYISFSKSILVEKSKDPKVPDSFMKLRFVDSFRFLSRSLDKLSETLDSSQCNEVKKYFYNEKEFNLMRRKGIFPYSYVSSFEKLDEEGLPSKEKFFDNLRGEPISDEDYDKAKEIWNTFNCKTLNDYAMLYLKTDVLLLADVFENFRKVCLKHYKLDPAHYLTAPSLSWDAMLKYTKIELELLTDIDMLHFFKKGVRGGVAQCSKRHAVANNKFLPNFDISKPESYIMYLDATNLYGSAMSQSLPFGDFKWIPVDNFDCTLVKDDASKGYVLEVDLEYPHNLHHTHNDLPFCPENIIPPTGKHPKLIPNLNNKEKYIIHYRNLKQCLKYGLKLRKIHRILEFSQLPWLKKYIDLNTLLRNQAMNDFEKDLFKLLVNAIFGKALENIDKRKAIHLISHWENTGGFIGARSLIAKPQFKTCSVFNENLVAIHLANVKMYYDKPLYIGFSVLDISKTILYEFFYGYIKQKYGDSAKLCYTDTDSLILEVFTKNFYEDLKQNINHFDTSNYSKDNEYEIPITKSVVGKMKDEFGGTPIAEFYGTCAKVYCINLGKPFKKMTQIKKAKGVSANIVKNQLHLNDYVRIVQNDDTIYRKMYVFVSSLHTIYTELRNKVALSAKDDKRYVIPHDVNTLAWGHFLTNQKAMTGTLDDLLQTMDDLINLDNFVL
ncbi:unnamed protein product [Psylliodes chrysocephalus]|uniref:C2H2-type domain-containing protein n=1 Tax=Psylliodes chrysocephalus TaxID=3402493 RepID=A0A9P0G4I4_9CUCU|nr:unnamed protein product [Psylliodes chrysocephala]